MKRCGIDMKKSKRGVIIFLMLAVLTGVFFWIRVSDRRAVFDKDAMRAVRVIDDGVIAEYAFSGKKTVEEFLREKKLFRNTLDEVGIVKDKILYGGEMIAIARLKKLTLVEGEKKAREITTTGFSAQDAVAEAGVSMASDDFILPSPDAPLSDGMQISVVRVVVSEDVVHENIPFETKEKEDDSLGWRVRKIGVKGEKGMREKKYRVVSHNGKVIKKTLVSNEVTKDPVTEEVVQGTYVKTGKKSTGQGTWYAFTGTLSAASPWLPLGSYAKVTNRENGKSVVVKINDRGPTGPGRIIDLDKVAFSKIASIGAGVIDVSVEEVLN